MDNQGVNPIKIRGLQVWIIKGGFNCIKTADRRIWMYCQMGWKKWWKVYPPENSPAEIRQFETEDQLFDYVLSFNQPSKTSRP